jgi:hypothetical protein
MNKLITNGYGSSFTNLTIENDTIIKESTNTYGNFKITNEIGFYKYILEQQYNWKIPVIYHLDAYKIIMKYYKTYIPIYKLFYIFSKTIQFNLITFIIKELEILHTFEYITLNKEDFINNIKIETQYKILSRYKDIDLILNTFDNIKYVNSIKLLSFNDILIYINKYIDIYIDSLSSYTFSIIHGDCQFSNILYNEETNDIIFIDPRGYFGDKKIYGLKEYDIAKVYFALSGYDYFDKLEVNNLIIRDNNNLIIDDFSINLDFLKKIDIISVLVISIWLGNAHAFKHNPMKTAMSHFYARYLGTLLFRE